MIQQLVFMSSPILTVTTALVSTIMAFVWWKKRQKMRCPIEGIPCVPDPHWLLGHLTLIGLRDFQKGLKKLSVDHACSNGLSCFWLVNSRGLCVTRGPDVKLLLSQASSRSMEPLIRRHYERFLGYRSLIVINGKSWRRYRTAIHRAFTPQALRDCQGSMNYVSLTMVSSLNRRVDGSPEGTSVTMDMLPLFRMATMDYFGSSALGIDFQCCETLSTSPAAKAFEYLSEDATRRIMSPFNPFSQIYDIPTHQNRLNERQLFALRELLSNLIKARRNGENSASMGPDLLTSIINTVESKSAVGMEDGKFRDALTDEVVSDMLMTLLFAGYDTTSITLAYAIYLISQHPKVEELCVEESIRTLGPDEDTIPSDFDPEGKLHYLRAVVYETLRLYPSAPQTSRVLERPVKLHGHDIPVGTKVVFPIWAIQRDPANYPRPLEFLPERWARRKKVNGNEDGAAEEWEERPEDDTEDSENEDYIPPASRDAFVAFSAGARSCLGKKLAMQESVTLLAILLRDLKFQALPGYVPVPIRAGPIQKPEGGLPMIIQRRQR